MDNSDAADSQLGVHDINLMEQPASASAAAGTKRADRDHRVVTGQIIFLMADIRAKSAPPMELPPTEVLLGNSPCCRHQPTNETRG